MRNYTIFGATLLIILSGLFCVCYQNVAAQNDTQIKTSDIKDSIRNAGTLYYYGVDFSHMKITDARTISRSAQYRKVYPKSWIDFLEKEIIRTQWVRRALRKDTFYYKQNEIFPVSVNVFNEFIIAGKWSFPVDTVKYAVKGYDLKENAGLGMVLLPENFSKPKELALMWVVFFDIQTREVLWATEVTGKCGHMGYKAHWGTGIVEGFKRFIRKVYHVPRNPMYDNY